LIPVERSAGARTAAEKEQKIMREIRLLGPGDEEPLERFLAAHPDGGHLLRANLSRGGIEDHGAPYQGTYAGCLSRGVVTSVAAHCWNGMLLLQADEAADGAADGVVRLARLALAASGRRLSGLLGPWGQVVWVAWSLDLPQDCSGLDRPQQLMTLDLEDLILPEPLARGELVCRRARSSELELLYNWRAGFDAETLGLREDHALRTAARRTVDRLQKGGDNWVLTRGGRLVAGCTVIGETGETIQIGGVSTPKDRRNRGYGRAVVAGTLCAARDRGRARALLFTDSPAANPAAERAYRAIGFAASGEVGLVTLGAPGEALGQGREACISGAYGVVSPRSGRGPANNLGDNSGGRQARPQVGRS
jgi:GNAT superfamily N-acetyltransferase